MDNKKSLFYIIIAFALGMLLMYLFNNYKIEKKNNTKNTEISYQKSDNQNHNNSYSYENSSRNNINELTNDELVVKYLKQHGELPDYYITKSEAKSMGWVPSRGNLCEVAPGKAIGGDIWTNRQKSLPTKSGRKYYEADLNYNCGNRNADRVVFSNDGLVFVTFDHYRSFEEK
ncbi:ribonuclease domain-containing protein [Cloacibacterium sp. TD35]|uniref:ribonuclease domain-containing protein n=1 Tax=Cloacibacterium sp. TD35 TaxID=2976818 RepID=UPI00237E86FC|nr:ribonuclease domain-containing protein [Cloacibacterium sp. TD35]WDT68054.1 ribonuclease [Cloacibacterium sp. TD35]